jgi:hypothetical protein
VKDARPLPGNRGKDAQGARVRRHFTRLHDTRQRSVIGVPEIVALSVAGLLLVAAIVSYLFLLRPEHRRLQAMTDERAQLETQLKDMGISVGVTQDAETRGRGIVESLVNFEAEHLSDGGHGSTRVIEGLNRLIRKNGLRISGGLAFTQLQETAPGESQQQKRAAEANAARVVESVFPGVAITLTVEGTYPALRRFIREVEMDRQFIVINTIELEGIADSGGPAPETAPAPTVSSGDEITGVISRPASGPRGTLVSLRLDMAAYFRRARAETPDLEPTPSEGARR